MWSVEDEYAFTVARQFYAELFQDSVTDVTAANAALALNQACCHVRDRDEVPLDYWASYVHFGHGGPKPIKRSSSALPFGIYFHFCM
jgi:CHAT domain-containing protein